MKKKKRTKSTTKFVDIDNSDDDLFYDINANK